jgi:hypothetical protein
MSIKRILLVAAAVIVILNLLVLVPWIVGHDGGGAPEGGDSGMDAWRKG